MFEELYLIIGILLFFLAAIILSSVMATTDLLTEPRLLATLTLGCVISMMANEWS